MTSPAFNTSANNAMTASLASTAAERAALAPVPFTCGALTPEQMLDAVQSLLIHDGAHSAIPVAAGFLDGLRALILTMPIDELLALRAQQSPVALTTRIAA